MQFKKSSKYKGSIVIYDSQKEEKLRASGRDNNNP